MKKQTSVNGHEARLLTKLIVPGSTPTIANGTFKVIS